jgi:CarD family transcriptional regulator
VRLTSFTHVEGSRVVGKCVGVPGAWSGVTHAATAPADPVTFGGHDAGVNYVGSVSPAFGFGGAVSCRYRRVRLCRCGELVNKRVSENMAQSKKVSSPVVAKAAKSAALKHKSPGTSKAVQSQAPKSAIAASAKPMALKAAAPKSATESAAVKSAGSKAAPASAKAGVVKAASKPTKPAPDKKAVAKPVVQVNAPKAAAKPQTPAKPAAAKAALRAAAPAEPKAVTPAAKPAMKVFSRESVRAATPAAAPAASPAKAMPAAVAKPAAQRITAPVAAKSVAAAAPAAVVSVAAAAAKKAVSARHGFKTNEHIVYPAHGVGRIVGIEEQEIAGMSLELFVITFDKDKMTLRVPTGKLQSVGMRKLAEEPVVRRAMETLKGRARVKRTMWSRRAQEYEAKINSGDLVAIAEVVRDLYRSETQPEQSYSERQLYEAALDRMAREIAAVEKLDERGAVQRITEILAKSAKGRRLAAEGAEAEAAGAVDAEADDAEDADVKAA